MSNRDDRPTGSEARRAYEESAEGESRKIGEPRGRLEPGEIVAGRVDAGPTGERAGGYREAEPANRIMIGAGVVIVLIVILLAILFLS
jgi:hypothetical protein